MASQAHVVPTLVLYFAIMLENKYSKTTQTWVGMFLRHAMPDFTSCWLGCAKQKEAEYEDLGLF